MSELKRYTLYVDKNLYLASEENIIGDWVYFYEAEEALAERDKRIAELEALVQKMKCCQNCDVYNKNVNDIPFPCQVCVKHNKWRMK